MDENRTIIVILVGITILLLLFIIVVVLFSVFIKRKNTLLLERQEAQKRFEREIAETQIEIREETLRNISWELHDNIGQLLTLAKIQTQNAAGDEQQVKEAAETIGKGLEEIRALSRLINPEALKNLSLTEALHLEIERYNRMGYILAALEESGNFFELDKKAEIVIFRILQEFFTNTIKHSKAANLMVKIHYGNNLLNVEASDDGVGFDYAAAKAKNGIGLSNIETRAALIKSTIDITSKKGEGTQLRLSYKNN